MFLRMTYTFHSNRHMALGFFCCSQNVYTIGLHCPDCIIVIIHVFCPRCCLFSPSSFSYFPPQFTPHPLSSFSFRRGYITLTAADGATRLFSFSPWAVQVRWQHRFVLTSHQWLRMQHLNNPLPLHPPYRLTTSEPITQAEGCSHADVIWRPTPRATTNSPDCNASSNGLVWQMEKLWTLRRNLSYKEQNMLNDLQLTVC